MSANLLRSAIVLFISSFCTLVIEILAGRMMAPYVGVSLYTWTSIIGVVLAGISIGAWAGGWLADRRPVASTLGWLLVASGAAALAIAPSADLFASAGGLLDDAGVAQTLLTRVVVLSLLLFFPPSFLLGMISPVAVKLAVRELESAGRVVGRLYAISTAGSIAGTFVTGFFLIARFGSRATLTAVGVFLMMTALMLGGILGRTKKAAAAMCIAAAALTWSFLSAEPLKPPAQRDLLDGDEQGYLHREESQYYTIQVERSIRGDTGAPVQILHLDHLAHSYVDLRDPSHFEYGYLRLFDEVIQWKGESRSDLRFLFLGGGGYTLPRYLEGAYPKAEIDVVEIDPAVTRTARRFLGLPAKTRIRTFNQDARWHVMRSDREYDVIIMDVFNDLSVPYHLATREMAQEIGRLLAWDGVLLVNIIDNYERGRFLASYVRTVEDVFGQGNAALLMEAPSDAGNLQSTYVIAASRNLQRIVRELYGDAGSGDPEAVFGYPLPEHEVRKYVHDRGIVLRDDYVPVDNMLAPLFAERFVDEH